MLYQNRWISPPAALNIACYLGWVASIEIVVHQCQGTLPLIHLHTITRQIQKAQSRRLEGGETTVFQATRKAFGAKSGGFYWGVAFFQKKTKEQPVLRLEVPS